jgi:hypothetical protein
VQTIAKGSRDIKEIPVQNKKERKGKKKECGVR